MMSGDCQSQGLAEWLQEMGWHEGLKPCDLRKLNTPKMRSIWRHLQAHVVTSHTASTIRGNVLLTKLEEENIPVGQINYKLDSVKTLNKIIENRKIEQEIDKMKDEIATLDKKLQREKANLLERTVKEGWERHKFSEMEDKTTILELKHNKLLKDCKKVQEDKEIAVLLKSSKTSFSHSESNHQVSLVYRYVNNYKYPFEVFDDDRDEMLCSILKFKPDSILDGITKAAKEALRSLNSKAEISGNMMDKVLFHAALKENLRSLKILVIRNELNINECLEKLSLESNELKKEKEKLVKAMIENDKSYSNLEKTSTESNKLKEEKAGHFETTKETVENCTNQDTVNQLLDHILESIKEERKAEKTRLEQSRLMPDDEVLEDLSLAINNLGDKDDELWEKVEKKVSCVHIMKSTLYSSLIESGELNELLAKITQLASDFESETKCKNIICSSIEFTDLIMKEVEVFQRTPMVALLRKWNTNNEMLQVSLAEKFSNNSSLLHFLLQSEEKNSVINALVKYMWSLSINPQFH